MAVFLRWPVPRVIDLPNADDYLRTRAQLLENPTATPAAEGEGWATYGV